MHNDIDEFSTMAPAHQEAFEAILEDDDVEDHVAEALKLFEGKASVYCLTVGFGGMECAPTGGSLTAAFDYSPERETAGKKRKR